MVRFVALLVAATFVVLTSAVKSEFWKETTRITKPGLLSSVVEGWKCNHCELQSWNRNVCRLLYHLGGDTSLRNSDYFGVEVCTKAPEEVMEAAKSEMREKASSVDSKGRKASSVDSGIR